MRTLELVKNGKDDCCRVKKPLLNIDLGHILINELHLLEHVMDVMVNTLISEVIDWDKTDDFDNLPPGIHLKKLWVRSDPVVWVLMFGNSKIQLTMKALEVRICKSVWKWQHENIYFLVARRKLSAAAKYLQRNIQDVHGLLSVCNLFDELNSWSSDKFWHKAQNWLENFISLRGKRIGEEENYPIYTSTFLLMFPTDFLHTHKSVKSSHWSRSQEKECLSKECSASKSNPFWLCWKYYNLKQTMTFEGKR